MPISSDLRVDLVLFLVMTVQGQASRPFQDISLIVESGAMAGTIPRCLKLVPLKLASHMGAGDIHNVLPSILILIITAALTAKMNNPAYSRRLWNFRVAGFQFAADQLNCNICIFCNKG